MLDPISARVLAFPQEQYADVAVAILRTEAGRNPLGKGLHDLVGELSTRSDGFRTRWGAHNVRHHGTGTGGGGYDAKRPDPGSCDAGVGALSSGGYPSQVMVRTDRRRRGLFTQ